MDGWMDNGALERILLSGVVVVGRQQTENYILHFRGELFFSLSKMRKDKVCCVGCPKMSLTMIYDLPFSLRNEEFDRPQTENDNLCNICKHTAELEKGFFGFVSHAM